MSEAVGTADAPRLHAPEAPPPPGPAAAPDGGAVEVRVEGTWARVRRQRAMLAALAVIVALLALSALAPLIAPHDPVAVSSERFSGPTAEHWLGTDDIGRDTFSRALYAMRTSVGMAVAAVTLALAAGLVVGVVSGYAGGWVDWACMRATEALMAIPGLLLVLAVVGVFGPGSFNGTIGIALAFAAGFVRLVRGEVLAVRRAGYVEAAVVAGQRPSAIVRRHVLRNIAPPVVIQFFAMMGIALVAEGALSYLGLGVQPPEASLGTMLQRGFSVIYVDRWQILVPGLLITAFCLCFNLVADGLRNVLAVESEPS